ncbi:hypothetical protein H6G20_05875 [Desertifilum sp. FACHB-1129]|uniref:hypothetical protein n=1 Tax=unclassified Desertifilum TaxID=2621682 RepID=UPI0016866E73|nr:MULTISPECIES: hypothetical protein [unclassified Desertifilum]MBD2311185.1 hypothetical protein [Desertifilum sp. FACHB-1129]MBD2324370.1 hypothetical protein [Desertifilum sp. FACHB-866]MBD2334384.1 hypothetical protein [Desertifilum sp. FACHB-868]MDA0213231.1 hypothetical protein [Cyanobacteria bacterium FC1]
MIPTSRLYDALNDFLSQSEYQWRDLRHLKTLCWMVIGIIESQTIHLSGFGVHIRSRAQVAQSHQRQFRRWLSNRRIDVKAAYQALMAEALAHWGKQRSCPQTVSTTFGRTDFLNDQNFSVAKTKPN